MAVEKENFDYLLGMTMWNLTKEKKDELLKQRDDKTGELHRLQARTPLSLWKEDLDNLLKELDKVNHLDVVLIQRLSIPMRYWVYNIVFL